MEWLGMELYGCERMGRSGKRMETMEWDPTPLNAMHSSGMRSVGNELEQNGMQWDVSQWHEMGRDGIGWGEVDGTGRARVEWGMNV
eukprot:scaffold149766_cov18-Prasinocladus_malaysianus.AAC.1